jgi:tripartite-type tricarboxylate transporter receptor subunit TctC
MLGMISAATLCAAPFLQRSLPFDPARDFRAVSLITDSAVLLAVNAGAAAQRGWRDLPAFLAWARAHPGGARISHAGPGTVSHLALAALASAAGVELTQVPYRGGAQAALDAVSGTIEGAADLPTALVPPIENGRLRALGVSSGRRLGLLPEVPAFAEVAGLEGLDIRSWNALVLPAATPGAEARRLHAAVREVVAQAAFREAMRPLGYDAVSSESPEAAAAAIAAERPRWGRLVEASGARLD